MGSIEKAIQSINNLEKLSSNKTIIHTINPISKLAVTMLFTVFVTASFKYDIIKLVPFFIYPIVLFILSDTPILGAIKGISKLLPVFALIGIGNIFFDRNIILNLWGISVSGGVLSFIVFIIKSILILLSTYLFIATTGIFSLSLELKKLKAPNIFIWLLILLYRYLLLLLEEFSVTLSAYFLRAPKQKGINIKAWGSLLGNLFFKSLERAEQIYSSMLLRGFSENFSFSSKSDNEINIINIIYPILWLAIFILLRG